MVSQESPEDKAKTDPELKNLGGTTEVRPIDVNL